MLLNAKCIYETPVMYKSNKISHTIKILNPNSKITIIGMESNGDGIWYRLYDNTGWVQSKYIKIIQDIEFSLNATRYTPFSIQNFSLTLFSDDEKEKNKRELPTESDSSVKDVTNNNKTKEQVKKDISYSNLVSQFIENQTTDYANSQIDNFGSNIISKINSGGNSVTSAINNFGNNLLGSINTGGITSTVSSIETTSLSNDGIVGAVKQNLKNIGKNLETALINNINNIINSLFGMAFSMLNYVIGTSSESSDSSYNDPLKNISLTRLTNNNLNTYSSSYFNHLDQQISDYFKYKGANGQTVTHRWNNMEWTTDKYYTTPVLTSSKISDEVNFHKTLYASDYQDLKKVIEFIKTNLSINIESSDWLKKFNKFKMTVPEYHLINSKGYVFFTRPDLNILSSGGALSSDILNTVSYPMFQSMATRHNDLCLSLTPYLDSSHDFLPLLCNTARSYDVSDETIKTTEHGETLTGWKIIYGKHSNDSRSSGTFSVRYVDDNELRIYNLHKMWLEYIHNVSSNRMKSKNEHIRNFILDYACSTYHILTKGDLDDTIIFWSKAVGVFPSNSPSSSFSYNYNDIIKLPEVSVTYEFSFKEDLNPVALAEFNNNSRGSYVYLKSYNPNTGRCVPTMMGSPFIDTKDGGKTFHLRFRK